MKNVKSVWSWQGNHLIEAKWIHWFVLFIGFALMLIIWMFKNKIRRRYESGRKILFFSNSDRLWQVVGGVLLTIFFIRLSFYIASGYPMYWEDLNLHLCRLLAFLIYSLLLFNKKHLIKYLSLLAVVGFIGGIAFEGNVSEFINNNANYKQNPSTGIWTNISTNEIYKPIILEKLMIKDGFNFLHIGPDNLIFYESYGMHLSILLIPVYTMVAYGYKISVVEYHRFTFYGFITLFAMWIINIGLNYIPDQHWRSNYWYIGMDRNNEMADSLGVFTKWPQNILTAGILSTIITSIGYYIYIIQDKVIFFENRKFIQIAKSKNYELTKIQYKRGFKDIFKSVVTNKK